MKHEKNIEFAQEASNAQADIVMFPELAVCGYPPADFLVVGGTGSWLWESMFEGTAFRPYV